MQIIGGVVTFDDRETKYLTGMFRKELPEDRRLGTVRTWFLEGLKRFEHPDDSVAAIFKEALTEEFHLLLDPRAENIHASPGAVQ